jgi:hypothetical protein
MRAEVEFAENSPVPPPETAAEGVYCEGCHTIDADWQRPKAEVMPPRSSVKAEWPMKERAANGLRPASATLASARAQSKTPVKKPPRGISARKRAKAGR